MPQFSCVCLNTQGRKIKMSVMSGSENEAVNILKSRGLAIIEISEAGSGIPPIFFTRVKKKEIILFFRMFASLVKSDVSISEAINILEEQTESRGLKKVVSDIRDKIEGGLSLSEAMEENEKLFTKMGINMIKAGELGGILDISLERVADYLEESAALRGKLILSMMYPSIILVTAIAVVIFLVIFVIPKFASLLGSRQLPSNTQFLLDSADFVKKNGFKMCIGFTGLITFIVFLFKADPTKKTMHTLILKTPVIGPVLRYGAIVRFTKTMSVLLASNINLVDALKASGDTIENNAVNSVVDKMIQMVLSGELLSSALETDRVFTPMVKAMVKIGEHSGLMDESMNTAGELHEKILEDRIAKMSALIEPALILVLGGIVGYVAWGLISGMLAMYAGAA